VSAAEPVLPSAVADRSGRSVWVDLLGAEVRFYDAGGIRTRCIEAGSGPAVVFLHGVGGHAEAFARNVVPLSDQFRVISLDYLGFGLTDPPQFPPDRDAYVAHLLAFLDAAGVERAHLVGESLGGWVAMWTAVLHPERVGKLVSVCGARLGVEEDEDSRLHMQRGLADLRRLTAEFVAAPSREAVRKRMEWLFFDPAADLSDELVDIRWAMYRRSQATKVLADANTRLSGAGAVDTAPLTPEVLAGISQETLFLWTSHNPTTTARTAKAAAELVPRSRFELMQNCAHWPQWEDADTFNETLRDFLTEES
jgi:2-hydroxy-6-oxonona-2,4-dienedioate hydrolase